MISTQSWMLDKDYAESALLAADQHATATGKLRELEAERYKLVAELNRPSGNKERLRATAVAVLDGGTVEEATDGRARLREIDTEAALQREVATVAEIRFEQAAREARPELARELRPQYAKVLGRLVDAALDMMVAAKAEVEFREPYVLQDVRFAGLIQALPYTPARPDGRLGYWLRSVDQHYPELRVLKRAKKAGIAL